jgi:hypothetical protein
MASTKYLSPLYLHRFKVSVSPGYTYPTNLVWKALNLLASLSKSYWINTRTILP